MHTKNAKFRTMNSACLAILFVFLCSMSLSAHELGVSSISMEIKDGRFVVYSSYARAEFGDMITPENSEAFKSFAKNAIAVEIDGKALNVSESDVSLDNSDGLIMRHSFGELSGSKIKITSILPNRLSANHIQILKLIRNDKEISREYLTTGNNSYVFDLENLESPVSFSQFLTLGIRHIAFGFDHLLFLFALLLVVTRFGEIAKIITFFTLAHSITLSLAALNVISIPPFLVEPIIAISIIYVGLENIFKTEQKKRWLLAYLFGLVHGLGFAGVLQEIGIGSGTASILPLISFNFGVEIGQMAVILLILPVLWKLQQKSAYKTRLVPICSVLIAFAGFYWLIERIL